MCSLCTAGSVSAPQVSGSALCHCGGALVHRRLLAQKGSHLKGRAVHSIKDLGAQVVWAVVMCHGLPQRVMISASATRFSDSAVYVCNFGSFHRKLFGGGYHLCLHRAHHVSSGPGKLSLSPAPK